MPGRDQKSVSLLDANTVSLHLLMNLHLFIKTPVLQCLLLCLEVLSFEIVATETILKEQTGLVFLTATAENQILSHSSELEKLNNFQFVFVQ